MKWIIPILVFLPSFAFAGTVRTICASGCDHTTIASAESASIDGDILEFRDSGTYDEKWTPGGTRTMRVQTGFGYSPLVGSTSNPQGAIETSSMGTGKTLTVLGDERALRFRVSGGGHEIIHIGGSNDPTVVIEECKFSLGSGNDQHGIEVDTSGAYNLTVRRSEFDGGDGQSDVGIGINTNASGTFTIENCVFYDNNGTGGSDIASSMVITGSQTGIVGSLINNTFVDGTHGIIVDERVTMTNNMFADNTDDIQESDAFDKNDATFNFFEQEPSTGWPASNLHSVTATFVNAAANDFHLDAASDGIDDGTNTGLTVDFDNDARTGAFDIGFDEVPTVGPPSGSLGLTGVGK